MYNTDLPNRAELPSSKQLFRSTIIAVIVAAVLLVTIVLPAEYGVDPTRIGRVFGLTRMGEIKQRLAVEAQKDRVAEAEKSVPKVTPTETKPAAEIKSEPKSDEMTVTLKPGDGVEIKL